MANVLHELEGKKIQNAVVVQDYLQLVFTDGETLNIFNNFKIVGCLEDNCLKLVGCEISSVHDSSETIDIVCLDGKKIHVGMTDSDFNGPEALELIKVDGKRIVWRD